jgi:hypothetical protein
VDLEVLALRVFLVDQTVPEDLMVQLAQLVLLDQKDQYLLFLLLGQLFLVNLAIQATQVVQWHL